MAESKDPGSAGQRSHLRRTVVFHNGTRDLRPWCGPTPTLLRLITSHQIAAGRFVTHHFELDQFMEAYDVFARAGDTGALKVVLTRSS